MDTGTILKLIAGLVLLVGGAEALVRGSSGLAARAGLSQLVIGLTVVAFGTSSPEMAVSLSAAVKGNSDLALGNVVGSNIFNVLFILGLCAAVTPLAVSRQLIRLDVPIMVGVSLLALLFGWDGRISRPEGVFLVMGLILYVAVLLRLGRQAGPAEGFPPRARPDPVGLQVVLVLSGLALLGLGSRWLVSGAVSIARGFGLSELIIGLTIVAAGTSLPEVASSVMATLRGQRDIAVGNVVGSNIFNILGVLGLSAVIAPAGIRVVKPALTFDLPIMSAVAFACLPIFFTGHRIARWEGWLFLFYYVAYTAFLVLDAQDHDAAPVLGRFLLTFVIPLTVITLGVVVARHRRAHGHRGVVP